MVKITPVLPFIDQSVSDTQTNADLSLEIADPSRSDTTVVGTMDSQHWLPPEPQMDRGLEYLLA